MKDKIKKQAAIIMELLLAIGSIIVWPIRIGFYFFMEVIDIKIWK